MKSQTEEFYENLHQANRAYAGGKYNTPALVANPAFRRWAMARAGQTVRLLDVGCGKGFFLKEVTEFLQTNWQMRPVRLAGVDMVRSPDDVFGQLPVQAEFIQQNIDGVAMALEDASFDALFCNHVLEHVFNTEHLVRDLHRVLVPGGLAVISVPNLANWVNRICLLFGGQPIGTEVGVESITYGFWPPFAQKWLVNFKPAGHIRDFTPQALADLVQSCGFRVVGWWNQDERTWLRLTAWSGRNVGVILIK